MKTLSERNRILNEVKDSCYLAFFDGNPEEGGKEILTGRKKVNFPVATNGYVKSTNQLDFTGGEEDIVKYGETSQKTYTGKNLFDIFHSQNTITSNGMTIRQEDGWIIINGTTEGNGWTEICYDFRNGTTMQTTPKFVLDESKTYSLSCVTENIDNQNINLNVQKGYNGSSVEVGGSVKTRIGITGSNGIYRAWFRTFANTTFSNAKIKIQLEEGSSVTDFEPYVGGIPAPNPDYPQDVQNITIGNVELCKLGDYQDYLYTENGKWYVHKRTGKAEYKASDVVKDNHNYSNIRYATVPKMNNSDAWGVYGQKLMFCSHASALNTTGTWDSSQNIGKIASGADSYTYWVGFATSITEETMKDLLDGMSVYYILKTPTDTEITDQATIAALEEMFGNATGVAKYWGVYDSEVGGKLLYYFIMPYDVNIVKGSTVTINAGNCVLKEG